MVSPCIAGNARTIEAELAWLARVLDDRFAHYFGQAPVEDAPGALDPPSLCGDASDYARIISVLSLDREERLALVLALAPHLRPQLLDIFHTRNQTFDCRFPEFGGVVEAEGGRFLPTGETLAFLLGGADLVVRLSIPDLLSAGARLQDAGLVQAHLRNAQDPLMRAPLHVGDEMLARLTTGASPRPLFGPDFPAQLIETRLDWSDLVLHPATRRQVVEIETWIEHGDTLMKEWGMASKLRPGLRSLFYGPPGTGKTMTACLLGKATGRDVYRIDLSLVVSKYIGETEKNLARVFDLAQARGWILFFDEADALFGKRSETRDAHDRFANQEISFLLQRVETFDGIIILASNFRDNIDNAFARRFELIVYFPMPRVEERFLIWSRGFSPAARLAPDLDLSEIARDFPLSGGAIMNAVRHASLAAIGEGARPIARADVLHAVRRELAKEGRTA